MHKDLSLLIVEDDDLVIQAVRMALPPGWRLSASNTPDDVPNVPFHAALVDLHLSGHANRTEGLAVIQKLSERDPHAEIIAMSGDLDREVMEKTLRAGATRFLAKPLKFDELILTLNKIEAFQLLKSAATRGHLRPWIGDSEASNEVRRWIASLKGETGPILIEGESGTGKEVAAQLIHDQAGSGPMVSVNVASIPENLFESEFFGHVRGSFTGAEQNKMGLAEAAHGGDLFLDEIEALSLSHQAKLLRFLETGEIRKVGSRDTTVVQTRVIAASNQNLESLVAEKKFREDLMWRLKSKKIHLPPLRHRASDIPVLVKYFLSLDRVRRKELGDDALQALMEYRWPGNVRELKRVCEQLLLSSPLPVIRKEDVLSVLVFRPTVDLQTFNFSLGLTELLNQTEAHILRRCLDDYNDVDEVSRVLKISRSSLYKKIKDHNIEWKGAT